VDIKKALREESPYLLFYQVQPIDEELALKGDPPAFNEAPSGIPSLDPSKETLVSTIPNDSDTSEEREKVAPIAPSHARTESNYSEEPVGRNSISSNHRSSIVIDDNEGSLRSASRGRTAPPTPDEHKTGFLSVSRQSSRIFGNNRSRPSSPSSENRLSVTLSRLTGRPSKDKLIITEASTLEEPVIVIDELLNTDNAQSLVKEKKDAGLARSKSKKDKKKDKFRSKSREPGETLEKAKHKEKNRPDRECLVM
jgi:hypothetical protein